MKNILFVTLLSTVTLTSAQFSYAGKCPPNSGDKDSGTSSSLSVKPMICKASRRWSPAAPVKRGSPQERYWVRKVQEDGGVNYKFDTDGQIWIRER